MSWLTGRDTGTKARPPERRRVRKCTRHGNAEPCPKCRIVNQQAKTNGTGPRPCPKCDKTMHGGVCPNPYC